MQRYQSHAFVSALVGAGLLLPAAANAASVTKVERSTWGASNVPSYVTMYVYVPDNLAAKPPIVVALHSCGTPVSGYVNSITGIQAGADQTGFILILPEATGQNCWDVGTTQSLTHDGGGDTQAIAQMVKYALMRYSGDEKRVYAMGGSSGAMMTQALMAVYPDVFRAGSARAGVAAGCWADGYASSNQWSNNCANGTTTKSAQAWGDGVRAMFPGYSGHRPRIQLFHGTADQTIHYPNLAESIKEWTNVLELPTTPTSTDSKTTSVSTYARQFWANACGYNVFETWAGANGGHSMAYEQADILAFFGLDQAGGEDPEPPCPADGGAGGASAGGASAGGASGNTGGTGPAAGSPGVAGGTQSGGSGGTLGAAGSPPSGGSGGTVSPTTGGAPSAGSPGVGTGGSVSPGGGGGVGGSVSNGGSGSPTGTGGSGTAGSAGRAGYAAAPGGFPDDGFGDDLPYSEGCGIAGHSSSKPASAAALALGLALMTFRRRNRNAKR